MKPLNLPEFESKEMKSRKDHLLELKNQQFKKLLIKLKERLKLPGLIQFKNEIKADYRWRFRLGP